MPFRVMFWFLVVLVCFWQAFAVPINDDDNEELEEPKQDISEDGDEGNTETSSNLFRHIFKVKCQTGYVQFNGKCYPTF